jgi:hypothetical protein
MAPVNLNVETIRSSCHNKSWIDAGCAPGRLNTMSLTKATRNLGRCATCDEHIEAYQLR